MFINRLYFNQNGDCIFRYEMQGDIRILTPEEEVTIYPQLQELNLSELTIIEIPEEDVEIRNNLGTCYKVNLIDGEFIFDFNFPLE